MLKITVPKLRVEVVTGPTCYPTEGGFSAVIAYVQSDDPAILSALRRASREGAHVNVVSAGLELTGHIGKLQFETEVRESVAISVDSLRYIKQGS